MKTKIIFQEAHCEVSQIESIVLKIKLKGFLKIEHLNNLTSFMNDFMKKNSFEFLMVNHSELKVLSKEIQEHLAKMVTIITNTGIKKIAIIPAEDVFAKAAFDKISKDTKFEVDANAFFPTEENALEWLLQPSVKN